MKSHSTSHLLSMALAMFFITHQAYAEDICEFTGSSAQDTECFYKRYEATETELNTRYKRILTELDAVTKVQPRRLAKLKPKFIAAQKAWVKYRESECRSIEVWYTGGTLQSGLYLQCMERLAKGRIEALSAFTGYGT